MGTTVDIRALIKRFEVKQLGTFWKSLAFIELLHLSTRKLSENDVKIVKICKKY